MRDIEELAATAIDCGFHIHKELGPGLLMNFGCETFRDGLKRIVNRYEPLAPSRLRVNQISFEPN